MKKQMKKVLNIKTLKYLVAVYILIHTNPILKNFSFEINLISYKLFKLYIPFT